MVRKRIVSTVMSCMMAATVLTTVPLSNNVKAATKWDTTKSVTKEQNGVKYSAYLSEDGKES